MTELSTQSASNPFALAAADAPMAKIDKAVFEDSIATGTWLPSLRLVSGKSKMVEAPANLTACHFYYCRNSNGVGAQDLGQVITIVAVASRVKAMRQELVGKEMKWVSYFDIKSDKFQEIIREAGDKGNTGSFYGPEYLVWVDGATDIGGGWATLHCGNKTARGSSSEIEKTVGRADGQVIPLKLVAGMVSGGKYSWEAYTVEPTMTQLQAVPTVEDIKDRAKKFQEETVLGVVVDAPVPVEGGRAQ